MSGLAEERFIEHLNKKFKFGSIVCGPSTFKFYDMLIVKNEDFARSIHADDKLNALKYYFLSRAQSR